MTDLDRDIEELDDLAVGFDAVIDGGISVQHCAPGAQRFLDPVFRFAVAVLAGVAVDRRREQVGFAFVLQIGQKLDMFGDEWDAGARLD